jgi:N-acetyl-1-D-myo-inositol-2-amino-2-deoxy-alpha-D-glucopyranoside deacetylase
MKEKTLTLMAVHAHPDDEAIGTGGILAKYASMGVRTVVVYCTRGEEGDINNPDFVFPDPDMSIEDVRMKELAEALAVLDVQSPYFLGYRDSGMAGTTKNDNPLAFANADIEEATSRLVDIIREVKPDVIVTYNEKGVYGHPDHIMANRVTVRAFSAAGDPGCNGGKQLAPWQAKKFYYTALSLERMRKMRDLAEERGEELGLDPEFLGTPDDEITTTIDVEAFIPKKFEALLCHQSQVGPKSFFKRVPQERINEFFRFEHYVCISGCNMEYKEEDLFEGLW